MIYRRTKNQRAVQLLLGHRLESTVRYLSIEVDGALEIAEQTEVYGWKLRRLGRSSSAPPPLQLGTGVE